MDPSTRPAAFTEEMNGYVALEVTDPNCHT